MPKPPPKTLDRGRVRTATSCAPAVAGAVGRGWMSGGRAGVGTVRDLFAPAEDEVKDSSERDLYGDDDRPDDLRQGFRGPARPARRSRRPQRPAPARRSEQTTGAMLCGHAHAIPGGSTKRPATLPSRSKLTRPTCSPDLELQRDVDDGVVAELAGERLAHPLLVPAVLAGEAAQVAATAASSGSACGTLLVEGLPRRVPVALGQVDEQRDRRVGGAGQDRRFIGSPVRGSTGRPKRWNAACRVVPRTSPISAQVLPAIERAASTRRAGGIRRRALGRERSGPRPQRVPIAPWCRLPLTTRRCQGRLYVEPRSRCRRAALRQEASQNRRVLPRPIWPIRCRPQNSQTPGDS